MLLKPFPKEQNSGKHKNNPLEAALQTLSLSQKIGQLLMVHFQGEEVNEEAKLLVQELGVGGIIYYEFSNGSLTPDKVSQLSSALQQHAPIPLFIAVDQEGGSVNRLSPPFMQPPASKTLGITDNPLIAFETARAMGRELKQAGINMNLAPVVDVASVEHSVIGARSFGKSPELCASFGKMAMRGYQEAGIISVLKHFPGHGSVTKDSHETLPIVTKTLEELKKEDLLPFIVLAHEGEAVMTAHLLVPCLDKEAPVTLSSKALLFLRDQVHFHGLIISDSLVMQALYTECCSVEEVALRALEAGCDLLLLGGRVVVEQKERELKGEDVQRVHLALMDAVESGRLNLERIDQAVERVLALKRRYLY